MTETFSQNPKITYAGIRLQDILDDQEYDPDPDFQHITAHQEEVLQRYQPIFTPDHIPQLTEEDFLSFLLYRNNHHWDSLHRIGSRIVEDMDLLRGSVDDLIG